MKLELERFEDLSCPACGSAIDTQGFCLKCGGFYHDALKRKLRTLREQHADSPANDDANSSPEVQL